MDLADELAAIFSAFGLSCELDGDGVLTSSPVAEEGLAASPFCVLLSVSDGVLKASSASAYRVPLAWRPALTRFLAHINAALAEGAAELDVRDGELRFRVSFPVVAEMDCATLARHAVALCLACYPAVTAACLAAGARSAGVGAAAARQQEADFDAMAKAAAADAAKRLAANASPAPR
jgi:hypothetical protein